MSYKLLFICSGNICRSPIAEGLAPILGEKAGHTVEALSAGTLGLINRPADPKAIEVSAEVGVDISKHKSQPITAELLDWADYVLVMERKHGSYIRSYFPEMEEKILEISTFGGMPKIPDPIGTWKFTFRKRRKELEKCLTSFFQQLPSEEN